jgi:EpsI family protein
MTSLDSRDMLPRPLRAATWAPHPWSWLASHESAAATGLVLAFCLAYYPTGRHMVQHWSSNDMYSYGFAVPLISGYLLWLRRDRLRHLPWIPSYAMGGTALFAALLMLVLGRVSSTNLLEAFSLPVGVFAVALLVLGSRMTRAMAFPLAYLLTMIPFWDFLTDRVHEPFQLYSATLGVATVRMFDIPVFRDGVFIHLPEVTLEVADVCSGVNNLIAVLCIGLPAAHFYVRSWIRRALILGTAVLVALLGNGVRVAMVALFVYHGVRGPGGDIHGPFSLLRTTLIAATGYAVLFWLIARLRDRQEAPPVRDSAASCNFGLGLSKAAVALATAMLLMAVVFEHTHTVRPVPLKGDLSGFPDVIGSWRATGAAPNSPGVQEVGFDQALLRDYADGQGRRLELLLGYFQRQEQSRELVGFRLRALIGDSASVWRFLLGSDHAPHDAHVTVNGSRYYVAYWYVINGRETSQPHVAKWWTTWDALTSSRSNGGVVIVRTEVYSPAETLGASRVRVQGFIKGVEEASRAFFPG